MYSNYRKTTIILISLMIPVILACNATFNFGYPTPTITIPTQIPTATSVPLSTQLTLVSQPYIESNQSPAFTITAQTPQLSGSDDTRVQVFNQRLDELVQTEITVFREEFTNNPATEVSTNSFLEVAYTLVSQHDDIWSFKFAFSFYYNGAAHPGHSSITLTYDLDQGRELDLDDLFLPNSNFLETLAGYCITELANREFGFDIFSDGAQPILENYRNWNIAPEGLLITFDEYQVAPYAAGLQTVLVPYGEVENLIDPDGPLGGFIR